MANFIVAKSDFELRLEPRLGAALANPPVSVRVGDRLEVMGNDIPETLGAIQILWVKVRTATGEGFANRLMTSTSASDPEPDGNLSPQFRRTLELPALATLCYRNAIRSETNSAILLALAFAHSGSAWSKTLAQPKVGDRMGLFGFTQPEWDAALLGAGPEVDVKSDHIARARAQCEIAGVVLGRAWRELAAARKVRAVDLYSAFLSTPETAAALADADPAASLSTVLSPAAIDALAKRAGIVKDDQQVPAAMTAGEFVAALAAQFELALTFVRAFSDGLVGDNVPPPLEVVEKTETELAHEDEVDGDDDPVGPGVDLVVPGTVELPVQPGDGTLVVSEAHLVALWKRSLFPIDGRGIVLFGLRGCLPVDPAVAMTPSKTQKIKLTPVDYRQMRCTIGQWRPGKGFALFPGSTVPFSDLIDNAANRGGRGVNQMGRGRYRNYAPGWHKRKQGKGGHWALLQESDVSFQRTAGDVNYTPEDAWDAGRPGDNIHCAFHMGPATDPAAAVYSSAGCQVVAGMVTKGVRNSESGPWKTFIRPFKAATAQPGAEYVLFDAVELERMILTQIAGGTAILRMGSEGLAVKELQGKLGLSDPDGKFGRNTLKAVLKFQHATFGRDPDDGIVGLKTAQALGLSLPAFVFADAIRTVVLPAEQDVDLPSDGGVAARIRLGGATDPKFGLLLELVSRMESHGNYNAFFSNTSNENDPRFVEMTVKQVRIWQRNFINTTRKESAAVGRYQIIQSTLADVVGRLGLDGDEVFDSNLQDRMAIDLLGVRNLAGFLAGRIDRADFGNNLAMEWASLPVLRDIVRKKDGKLMKRGMSYYAGVGSNKAHIGPEEVEAALKRVKP